MSPLRERMRIENAAAFGSIAHAYRIGFAIHLSAGLNRTWRAKLMRRISIGAVVIRLQLRSARHASPDLPARAFALTMRVRRDRGRCDFGLGY